MPYFENRVSSKLNKRRLIVVACDNNDNGDLGELIVDVHRMDNDASPSGSRIRKATFESIIEEMIETSNPDDNQGEVTPPTPNGYTVSNTQINLNDSTAHNLFNSIFYSNNEKNLTLSITGQMSTDFMDVSQENGNPAKVIFTKKNPILIYEETTTIMVEYNVEVFVDGNVSLGEETIQVSYTYEGTNPAVHFDKTLIILKPNKLSEFMYVNCNSNIYIETRNVPSALVIVIANNSSQKPNLSCTLIQISNSVLYLTFDIDVYKDNDRNQLLTTKSIGIRFNPNSVVPND